MPLGEWTWTGQALEGIQARLERELDRHGPLPLPRDDLVAETLLRLVVASERKALQSPMGYARAILLNLVRDHIRDLERTERALDALSARIDGRATARDGNGALEDGELVALLLERSGLTRLQRRVIDRLYFGGLSLCEVARELRKNPGTVLRHQERALSKLSRCAGRMGVEP